jgi:hypothetical protein
MLESVDYQGPVAKRLRRSTQPVKYDMDSIDNKEL